MVTSCHGAGAVGERFVLGGENLTFSQLFETLCDLTGLAEPSAPKSKGLMKLAGSLFELNARLRGGEPRINSRLARDYVDSLLLGDQREGPRRLSVTVIARRVRRSRVPSVVFGQRYLSSKAAGRVRLELRPV